MAGHVVTLGEYVHIKLLLANDKKRGSKYRRIAKKIGRSPETIRCIDVYETFRKYQERKIKPQTTGIKKTEESQAVGVIDGSPVVNVLKTEERTMFDILEDNFFTILAIMFILGILIATVVFKI